MIRLNSSKGLGDAICLRAVALHLIDQGEAVELFTPWPEVFSDLASRVTVRAPSEIDDDTELRHVAPCSCRIERVQWLDLFDNARQRAGVPDAVLRASWTVTNERLVSDIRRRAGGRPILVFQPVKRANNRDQAMVRPDAEAFNQHLAQQGDCYRVKVGHPGFVDDDRGAPAELDLFGKTSVPEVFDVVSASDRVFAEPCFLALLAQAMDKSLVCMFSGRAPASTNPRVSNINPRRIFHKQKICTGVWDNQIVAA